jgi:cytochrome P450
VAFGSGIHHCLGAYLARMDGQEALGERFPSLHLEVPEERLEYVPSLNFRSLKSLPVSWS